MTGKISPVFNGKVSKNNKVELPKEEQNNINDKNIDKNDNDKTNKNKPVKNPTLPGVLAGKILPSAYPKLFPFINISSGMIPPMKNPKETTKFPLAGLIMPPKKKPKKELDFPTLAGVVRPKGMDRLKIEMSDRRQQLIDALKKYSKNKTDNK